MKIHLGLDWGGTYIKAGLVDSKGNILKKVTYASKDLGQKEVFISQIQRSVKDFSSFDIKGVGIGVPGIINTKKGFIYYLPNIPGWENFSLTRVLEKKLKLPVFLNNDANAFALAESYFGAAKNTTSSIFLTLGTGLGGAVILNGKLLETEVSAQELGHVPLTIGGRACSCGGQGCIETFVGNKYLLKRYKQLKKRTEKIEVKDIFERGQKGEKEALIVWSEFSLALGKFLAGMVNIFNPQVIVLGGGVSGAYSLFKPLVLKTLKEQVMWPQRRNLKICRAKLKDAGIVGAALLALK